MRHVLVCVAVLLLVTLACGPLGGADEEAVQTAIAQTEVAAMEIQAEVDAAVAETAAADPNIPPSTETPASSETPATETDGSDSSEVPVQPAADSPVYIRSHLEVSDDEQRYVIGEVANEGTVDVHFVKITADFYDAAGNPAGTGFTYASLNVLPGGSLSPFRLATHVMDDVNPDWARYELTVESQEITGECSMCYAEFEVLEEALSNVGGRVKMEGVVSNVGPSDAQRVQITATYYDQADSMVGMGFTFADEDVIPVGGSSPFSIILYTGLPSAIDHYTLYVEGTELN
jgi:hypothetical protein